MTDILNQIDESIARNEARFDPFGPAPLPEPVKSGIEEEAAEPEAVVEAPALGERQFMQAFAEIAADREAVEAVIAEAFASGGIVRYPSTTEVTFELWRDSNPSLGVQLSPTAPLVDEPVEPDPAEPERTCILASCAEVGRHNHLEPPPSTSLYCAGCGRDITYSGVCARCPEPPWAAEMRALMARDTRPWWRRYLPGGTR